MWNFRGTVGKENGPDGWRHDVKGTIPDLDLIEWRNRRVVIAFDTNVRDNESAQAARAELSRVPQRRGARVCWLKWPSDTPSGVNGIDDYLPLVGAHRIVELFEGAHPHKPPTTPPSGVGSSAMLPN